MLDSTVLREDVAAVRRTGWSYTEGERDTGAAGLSARVFDGQAQLVGAMTVRGPTSRVTKALAEAWAEVLIRSAETETATRLLGGRLPTKTRLPPSMRMPLRSETTSEPGRPNLVGSVPRPAFCVGAAGNRIRVSRSNRSRPTPRSGGKDHPIQQPLAVPRGCQ
jgi:hypothetical protein